MKVRRLIATALGLAAVSLAATPVEAIVLDFANVGFASISFDGSDDFEFKDATSGLATGYDFRVTGSDGVGDAIDLLGNISGVFTIGSVTTSGTGEKSAPVSGSGSLSIDDGFGFSLTAILTWLEIRQDNKVGDLNAMGVVNLTGISYFGLNSDLLAMQSFAGTGSVVSTFQVKAGESLDTLKTNAQTSSYSAQITAPVPDGGTTLSLMGAALLGLGLARRKYGI